MPTRDEAKIRYIEKTIDEIMRLGDANKALAALANVNSDDNRSKPFVYNKNDGNFVRNMGTLSLIPADRRVDVGAKPWNTTWLPYDVRTIRGILESGRTPTIPHVPSAIIPENVRRLAVIDDHRARSIQREIIRTIPSRVPNHIQERMRALRRAVLGASSSSSYSSR